MTTYAGFDSNLYPGDEMLAPLHSTFAYAGYWLNAPPGETVSTWQGKRSLIQSGVPPALPGRQSNFENSESMPPAVAFVFS